jgi:hypothetical protein
LITVGSLIQKPLRSGQGGVLVVSLWFSARRFLILFLAPLPQGSLSFSIGDRGFWADSGPDPGGNISTK